MSMSGYSRRAMRPSVVAMLSAIMGAEPALAQGRPASSAVDLARAAERLQPGEWVWAPEIAPAGPVLIYVNLSDQRATVYRNGVRIGVSTISSGRPGHETPTGVFTILQKDARHHSTTYNNAPMFYMERLTWDGVALHAGGLPGFPESHGCVHLPLQFARLLYGATDFSVTVVIAGDAARHVGAVPAGVLAPFATDGRPVEPFSLDAPWRWTPEQAQEGPTTVIISKVDQIAVVLRNGVEIGRSAISLDDHDGEVHVLTLASDVDGGQRWLYAGPPGREAEAGSELSGGMVGRLRAPHAFYTQLRASLRPGDTVVITPAPIGDGSVGQSLTVMDAIDEPTGAP
ncbi:L,D-transpeptidase family protein [Brevundimonas intermedia]|uniref:L,D-transpeptidase family protein n=1 Tax=Brevundimonas intermedia TaxID=74315 RepID=UPI00320AD34E